VKYVINDDIVLLRPLEGPLATHIRAFATALSAQGYARLYLHRQVLLAACFSQWLHHHGIALRHLTADHPSRYLRDRARRARPRPGDAAALKHLMEFLRREGVMAAAKPSARRLTPAERYAHAYAQHLRDARALAQATIDNYVPFIRAFLTHRFGTGPVRLSCLSARDVVRYVQHQAPRLHLKRAKLLTTALRSFLQYARYRSAVTRELATAVPAVANWSMSSIPRAIGADQIRSLLASLDRRTALGRRNYAIVLLLARLGLRSGEVAFLELDDLDWDAGLVRVRGKRGHRTALPLPTEVGVAIAAYLRTAPVVGCFCAAKRLSVAF
jgi:integrase/recombinase XerD